MNEITIPLETVALLAALEGRPLALNSRVEALIADLGSRYGFLSKPISVGLADGRVLIRWANEPEEAKAEAAKLFQRALRRARDAEYERVAALCLQALPLQPSLQAVR
jgi:hypothetical protein